MGSVKCNKIVKEREHKKTVCADRWHNGGVFELGVNFGNHSVLIVPKCRPTQSAAVQHCPNGPINFDAFNPLWCVWPRSVAFVSFALTGAMEFIRTHFLRFISTYSYLFEFILMDFIHFNVVDWLSLIAFRKTYSIRFILLYRIHFNEIICFYFIALFLIHLIYFNVIHLCNGNLFINK